MRVICVGEVERADCIRRIGAVITHSARLIPNLRIFVAAAREGSDYTIGEIGICPLSVVWVILVETISKFLNCGIATTIVGEVLLGADDALQIGINAAVQRIRGIRALGKFTVRMSQLISNNCLRASINVSMAITCEICRSNAPFLQIRPVIILTIVNGVRDAYQSGCHLRYLKAVNYTLDTRVQELTILNNICCAVSAFCPL